MTSSLASSSRLTPLTSATSESGSSRDAHASSYVARMSSLIRPSSINSSVCSCRRSSHSASIARPAIRAGFVIPAITLTPPDDNPRRSDPLPWQDFTSKRTLYVPVKTEDIGWEEGGLWWHGKFHYREVLLYGGEDDRVVGKYRGGPDGYSYQEIWDQVGFDHQVLRKIDEPVSHKSEPLPSSLSSSKRTCSTSTSTSTSVASSRSLSMSSTQLGRSSTSASDSAPGSANSSRRASESTVDTAVTSSCGTPVERLSISADTGENHVIDGDALVDSLTECGPGGAPFEKLEAALLALRAQKDAHTNRLTIQPSKLRPGKSITLSDDSPSSLHHWPQGRGYAKLADTPLSAASRAGGTY